MSASGREPPALAVEDVSCRFGPRLVVDAVSFETSRACVTVIVGPSGCGKTTLLRLVAGIERPSAGRVLINGEEAVGPSVFVPPERRRVGLMFQDYALFPHLTARDNVMFGLAALPRGERRRAADDALARVGLARHADQRPGRLSGGEQQRLALARALAPAPRVLLMDEPFSNLDRGLREEVRSATLSVLREAGITTLIVTHDPEEALAVADHLVLLDAGRLVQAGPPASIYAHPANLVAARALSDVNVVPSVPEGGGLSTMFGRVAAPPDIGASSVVGFRPEHLALVRPGEGVTGRIEARSFRGASTLVTIAVDGAGARMRVAVPAGAVPHGDEVGVVAELRSAMIFPANLPADAP